jgi:hypothetical protein
LPGRIELYIRQAPSLQFAKQGIEPFFITIKNSDGFFNSAKHKDDGFSKKNKLEKRRDRAMVVGGALTTTGCQDRIPDTDIHIFLIWFYID